MEDLATKFKATISVNAVSLILGLGYITGLRFSAIICAGGFFSALIVVPLIYHFGQHIPALTIPPAPLPGFPNFIPDMNANQIFRLYAQRIGVGAMAGAGIIGIIRALPTIVSAFSLGFKQIFHPHAHADQRAAHRPRPQDEHGAGRDRAVRHRHRAVLLRPAAARAIRRWPRRRPQIALTGLVIAFVFAFLFTTVAALATAMTGNNPISGMTLVTLIIGSSALVAVGLQGEFGKYAAIVMGAVVCTALSMAGGFVTDLKVGYWLGADAALPGDLEGDRHAVRGGRRGADGAADPPAYGHTDPATGQFISGFMNTAGVPAPQANLFATILSRHLRQGAGHLAALRGRPGAVRPAGDDGHPAAGLRHRHVPAAADQHAAVHRRPDLALGRQVQQGPEGLRGARRSRGTLLASGFIAGGALMGVLGAVLNLVKTSIPDPERAGRLPVPGQVHRAADLDALRPGHPAGPDPLDRDVRRALPVPVLRLAAREGVAPGAPSRGGRGGCRGLLSPWPTAAGLPGRGRPWDALVTPLSRPARRRPSWAATPSHPRRCSRSSWRWPPVPGPPPRARARSSSPRWSPPGSRSCCAGARSRRTWTSSRSCSRSTAAARFPVHVSPELEAHIAG